MILCNYNFAYFLLYFMVLTTESRAMINDEFDENHNKNFVGKKINHPSNRNSILKTSLPSPSFAALPSDLTKEIFLLLQRNDVLPLRGASNVLKNTIDIEYWKSHPVNIRAKSSSPGIQDIKMLPLSSLSLSFEKWEQQDIEQLLFFKSIKNLRLSGLKSWDFSTGELFNPDPLSSCFSHILSILHTGLFNMFGMELGSSTIFANVTSLDLSDSSIGDYGVISFVAHFKKLQTLNISNNDIGNNRMGEVDVICNFNSLTSLNISKNNFSSETVKEMTQLTNLTSLDVSDNFISDTSAIKKLRQLPKLISFRHHSQREQKSSNNCVPIFFYYPLLPKGGRFPF